MKNSKTYAGALGRESAGYDDSGDTLVAECGLSDVRLIASAPEMLKALELALEYLRKKDTNGFGGPKLRLFELIRDTVNKARGAK